jgi:hypothetical protein
MVTTELDSLPVGLRDYARKRIEEFDAGWSEACRQYPHLCRLGWFAVRREDSVSCLEFYPEERRAQEAELRAAGALLGVYSTYGEALIAGLSSLAERPPRRRRSKGKRLVWGKPLV